MNKQALEYYQSKKECKEAIFDEVIPLHDFASKEEYPYFAKKAKTLPKGFYELAKLPKKDRIDFSGSFWETTLPYSPKTHEFLTFFFSRIDDVGIYLVKREIDPEFTCQLVYSLGDEEAFFRGCPSASEEELAYLKNTLGIILPEDYLCFLQIHNGFAINGDYGLIQSQSLPSEMATLQAEAMQMPNKPSFQNRPIDPTSLIPFYKTNGLNVYECFYAGWYPDKEMGNIQLSFGEGQKVDYSDPTTRIKKKAFPTFLDWLMNYMEPMNV